MFWRLYPQASGEYFKRNKDLFSPDLVDDLNAKLDLGKISRAEFFTSLAAVAGITAESIQSEIDPLLEPDLALVGLIKELKPSYKIGLLSNAGQEEIEVVYRDGIGSLFDITAISYEVGDVKPNPGIFVTCAQRLEIQPPDCLFVDDSMANIEAAQGVGMQALHYPNFGVIPSALSELA